MMNEKEKTDYESAATDRASMRMKILLPFRVFAEESEVIRIVIETAAGAYGILPQRLDGAAALVPGILEYETRNGTVHYLAVGEGILIKSGHEVLVSVRNAVGGVPLGELRSVVEKELMETDESEISARSVMARLESGFIRSFQELIDD